MTAFAPFRHLPSLLAAVLGGLLLAGCGGGGPAAADGEETATTQSVNPAGRPPTVQAPYLRLVLVDQNAANASDSGPGTYAVPYKTIGAALRALQPGDDIVIAPGTYREGLAVPARDWAALPTRIRAQTARTATVKGSVEVAGWTSTGPNTYAVAWSGEQPQQVFRAGKPLQQVGGTVFEGYPTNAPPELAGLHASEGGLWPGRVEGTAATLGVDSFTHDAATGRVVARLATPLAAGEKLEVSVQSYVLVADNVKGLTVSGLDFAHANTSLHFRQGAVKVIGDGNLLTDLVVRDMDAACVQLIGTDSALTNSTLERCGQIGISGRGTRLTISGNTVLHANTRGFNKWWEAGGMKMVGTGGLHQSTLRGNTVAYSQGDGIWIDWKNTRNLIEGNTTAYNSGFGIHYEASQTGTIRGNIAYGNGLRGIYLLESADCVIEGNAVFGNAMEGIAVVNGWRSAADPVLLPLNNRISGNALAWNDIGANWVQLVLPGTGMQTASDRNTFTADGLAPRMAMGFVSPVNPAYESLVSWQTWSHVDASSTTQLLAMAPKLRNALTERQLLPLSELPAFLARPGVQ